MTSIVLAALVLVVAESAHGLTYSGMWTLPFVNETKKLCSLCESYAQGPGVLIWHNTSSHLSSDAAFDLR
jgi:hypothetical protein